MALIWTLLSVILFLSLLQRFKNKKTLPPGPRAIPILGHFHLLGKNPHRDLARLARKHGPIMGMRFGFVNAVIVSSPAAAELFLKTHDLVFASRPYSEAAKYIGYEQRDLIFGPYGSFWRHMRKLCTLELLSNLKINKFGPSRQAEVGLFVGSLKHAAETKRAVDLSAGIFNLTVDMNSLMVLGNKYSEAGLDERGFKYMFTGISEVVGKFNIADYFPYIGALDLHGINPKMKEISNFFYAFFEKIIDDHAKNKPEEKEEDFVDTMMRIMESGEAGFEFDRRHVKAVLLDLLAAGSDTSAGTAEWALTELIRHPTKMNKLQQELETVVGMENTVEESQLSKLPYLDCVIKETFRLHPVVPLLIPHESVEDCTVDGFFIPKKSRITVNVYAIGRDPNVWSDPESFIPERFMGSNIDASGHDFRLIPFGSGRRGCPGMQLGLVVVKLVVAQLVHCFDWKLPEGMLIKDIDMSEHFGTVMTRAKHLVAIPTYRLAK